ncbi:MAG: hypothetical protein R3293_11820 [Candidatus Promineifilaceae bacterium]|nr:hypothetical protein [Candidatus Promineifilaceae bacterium]
MSFNLKDLFRKAMKDERKVLRPHFFADEMAQTQELVVEQVYVRLRLARMFLKNRRVLFQTKYPVVNALTRFSGIDGLVEVNFVVKPELAGNGEESDLDDVVTLDQTLLGPVLYRGGDMELMLGLYAAPADDWAQRFISLAEGISKLTLNATVTTAISVANTIKTSIVDSMSGDGLDLKLGLDKELKENDWLAPGHVVMIAAPDEEIDFGQLRVEDGELQTKAGKVYADHDYIVLAIEITSQRSDWQALGYGRMWQSLLKTAAEEDDLERVKEAYQMFTAAILSSEDLSVADQAGIVSLAQQRIKAIRDARAPTDFFDGLKGIDDLAAAASAVAEIVGEDTAEIPRVSTDVSIEEMMATDWIN